MYNVDENSSPSFRVGFGFPLERFVSRHFAKPEATKPPTIRTDEATNNDLNSICFNMIGLYPDILVENGGDLPKDAEFGSAIDDLCQRIHDATKGFGTEEG
jgi:hypothetical protein